MRIQYGDLGETEWTLMKICWKKGKSSAKVIHEESLKDKKRSYNAVRTTLGRLVKKKYLKREKFGPIWLYSPNQSENSVISRILRKFIKTVFHGNIVPVFIHFANDESYNKEDLKEIKKIINEFEKKK